MKNLRKLVELKKEFLYDIISTVSSNYSKEHLPIILNVENGEFEKKMIGYVGDTKVYEAARINNFMDTRVIYFVEGDWIDSLLKRYSNNKRNNDAIDFWIGQARKEGIDVEAYGFKIETIDISEVSGRIRNVNNARIANLKKDGRTSTPESTALFKYYLFDTFCDSYNILVPAENLDERLAYVCKELEIVDEELFRVLFKSGFALKPDIY